MLLLAIFYSPSKWPRVPCTKNNPYIKCFNNKTFQTSKISTAKVSENRSKDFKYKSVTFAYDGEEVPPVKVNGNFRVFKFENKNGPVYSLVINCTGDN